jgi:hypothetical protein
MLCLRSEGRWGIDRVWCGCSCSGFLTTRDELTAPLCRTFRTAGCCLPSLVQQIVVLPGDVEVFVILSSPSCVTAGDSVVTWIGRQRRGSHSVHTVPGLRAVGTYHWLVQYENEFAR